MTRIYCKQCDDMTPFIVTARERDPFTLGQGAEGDIICPRCMSVLATIVFEEEGLFAFQKVADLATAKNLRLSS
jgi:hypothetical protein